MTTTTATKTPSLSESIRQHVSAGFSGIWVNSFEHAEAATEIRRMCSERTEPWQAIYWDCDRGMILADGNPTEEADPIAPVRALRGVKESDPTTILLLPNYHLFLESPDVIQAVANTIDTGKSRSASIVILSPMTKIPAELEKLFVVVNHDLPDREQLNEIASDLPTELPDEETLGRLLDSAAGLTRLEAEGAFALSVIQHKRMDPATVWDIKAGALKKAGTLNLHRGAETFADLGGLDSLKDFCKRAMRPNRQCSAAKPRGVLLLGVPGCGKSAIAKALGNETQRPTITLDFGALMGSLVGQTEERTRQALQIVDRMAPCVLFVDEIEKGLSGASGSGSNDSGVSQRMLGTLLTWLNDHESDVFFVGTCNDIAALTGVSAGAFTRAERFDGIFFIDLPDEQQRAVIWEMYLQMFGLGIFGRNDRLNISESIKGIDDPNWTGAEIKSCCRLAALLGVSLVEASRQVVPVARTAKGQIDRLREWADGKALDANRPGIYSRREKVVEPSEAGGTNGKKPRRMLRTS